MNTSDSTLAWLALTCALALHVADEAVHDFLSFYNPLVASWKTQLPWLPFPVFTFEVWLAGLAAAILLLFVLARWVARPAGWARAASFAYGSLMTLNALGHFSASIYYQRLMPGTVSSPFLLAASLWLIVAAARRRRPT